MISRTSTNVVPAQGDNNDQEEKQHEKVEEQGRQSQEESINMINTLISEYDHLLASPFLAKKDDLGVPTIECTIGQRIFH